MMMLLAFASSLRYRGCGDSDFPNAHNTQLNTTDLDDDDPSHYADPRFTMAAVPTDPSADSAELRRLDVEASRARTALLRRAGAPLAKRRKQRAGRVAAA